MSEIQEYAETNPLLTSAVVGFCIQDGNVLLGVRKKTAFYINTIKPIEINFCFD